MNNTTKKLLSLLLIISSIFIFASCTDNTASEPEARATATAFMDAFISLDMEQAITYLDNQDAVSSTIIDQLNVKKVLDDSISASAEMAPYIDKFTPLYDSIINKISSALSYEITDFSGSGDEYTYTVDITVPDIDASGDIEAMLTNALSEHLTEEGITKIATDLLSSGKISINSNEGDIVNAVFDKLMPEIENAINNIQLETETIPADIVITNNDGTWQVNVEKSDLD